MCPFEGTGVQVTFTAAPVAGVTSYQWIVPPTVNLVAGQGTNQIVVTILPGFGNNANKQIRVTATSACGVSPLTIYYLLAQFPSTPGTISGPAEVCAFAGTSNDATYTIRKVTAAASYNWTVPAGAAITGHPAGTGENDTTITVSFSVGFTAGEITVSAANNCGSSANLRQLRISNTTPAAAGPIQGPTNACLYMPSAAAPSGSDATYFIRKVNGATAYNWVVPSGATITAHPAGTGSDDTVIVVNYSSLFAGGNITVTPVGNCGNGATRALVVTANLKPGTAGTITAVETQACPNRQVTYSIASAPANTTWLQWTVPANGTIVGGQGSTSIVVSYGILPASGNVTVTPENGCGTGKSRTLAVTIDPCLPPGPFTKIAQDTNGSLATIAIFPNPSAHEFRIQTAMVHTQPVKIRILDMMGRVRLQQTFLPGRAIVVGSDLRPGMYIIEIIEGTVTQNVKVVKN